MTGDSDTGSGPVVKASERVARVLAQWLAYPLAVAAAPWHPRDAIIVMGAPLRPDGALGFALQERVTVAAALWHRQPTAWLVVSGGITTCHNMAEAVAMSHALLQLGVDQALIVVEAQARNTLENARFSAALLRERGASSAWVVTQPFHLMRSVHCCRKQGLDAQGWLIIDGVEQARPRSAIKWTLREYAALAKAYLR